MTGVANTGRYDNTGSMACMACTGRHGLYWHVWLILAGIADSGRHGLHTGWYS